MVKLQMSKRSYLSYNEHYSYLVELPVIQLPLNHVTRLQLLFIFEASS
jgi:hypothetical protein